MQLFQSDKTELEPAPPPPAPPIAPRKENFSHNLANINLITKREYKSRVLRRNFAITTGFTMLLAVLPMVGLMILQVTLFDPTTVKENQVTLQVIEPEGLLKGQDLTGYLKEIFASGSLNTATENNSSSRLKNEKTHYEVIKAGPDEQEARLIKNLRESKFEALVVAHRDDDGELNLHYYSGPDTKSPVDSTIQQALERLVQRDRFQQAGLSSQHIEKLIVSPVKVYTSYLSKLDENNKQANNQDTARKDNSQSSEQAENVLGSNVSNSRPEISPMNLFGMIMGFMVLGSVLTYGQMVGEAAAEEKSNRIMELMLSATTPFQLLMGKVIGVGLVGLTQLALIGIATLIAMALQLPIALFWGSDRINSRIQFTELLSKNGLNSNGIGNSISTMVDSNALKDQIYMFNFPIAVIVFFPFFYILGYFTWATVFAAAGSLANRQEDVQMALKPIMLVCFLTIAPVGFTITGTDAVWVTVLSYFPLFTGPMMMARLATGNAYWWEGLISIGLLVASIVVLSWLGARVYRVGVLMYGSKPTFKRFFKLLFGGQ